MSVVYAQYGTFSADEIRAISFCKVELPSPQGGSIKMGLGTPYDPSMGVIENGARCKSCNYGPDECPGHLGHIELPIPVYNRMYIKYILKLLKVVCPSCSRPRYKYEHFELLGYTNIKPESRLSFIYKKLSNNNKSKRRDCPWEDCQKVLPNFSFNQNKDIVITYLDGRGGSKSNIFSAGEALNVFQRIPNEALKYLGLNHYLSDNLEILDTNIIPTKEHIHQFRPEDMIFTALPVIPPIARPYVIREGQKCDDDITDKYNSIIKICRKLRGQSSSSVNKKRKELSEVDIQNLERDLTFHISTMMDNKDGKSKLSAGGRPHKGLADRAKKKDGRIQQNIAGKRTDNCARSPICGGGVFLKDDELGVPRYIAEKLTRKFVVLDWNIHTFQSMVSCGDVVRVKRNGEVKRLDILEPPISFKLRLGDVVERKLIDGDFVLFNRQPTLRVESFQSFKTKIIDDYCFRLGLCFTTGFNADFDGERHKTTTINRRPEKGVTS